MTSRGTSPVQRFGGPALFVLLWSTGFVGREVRVALRAAVHLPRAAAGDAARSARPARRRAAVGPDGLAGQYGRAAVAGLLLHAGYLGGTFFGISRGIPAGVAAVIVSLQPVLTAVLAARVLGERPSARQWLGLVLGVGGVALVVGPGVVGSSAPLPVSGVVACLVALVSGTLGTVYQKRHGDGIPLVWGTAVQYAAATALLLVAALATEDMRIDWTPHFVGALVWLVLVLSIGAVLLLLLLLRRGTAAGVSSLYYLVPPATAVEAYFLFGERVSGLSLLGIGVTAVGVALVVVPRRGRAGEATTDGG